jgi:nitroreductase
MNPWQVRASDFPARGSLREQQLFLLRYAILAPSSNNSQSWRFGIDGDCVRVLLDERYWLRVCDPDRRELHLNAGCALENLLVAAEHFDFSHRVTYFPDAGDPSLVAVVRFARGGVPSPHRPPVLFDMLTVRHTSHQPHQDRPLDEAVLSGLQSCCVEPGLVLRFYADGPTRRAFSSMIVRGDLLQFADPAFRRELAECIGQGMFGTPWLTSQLLRLLVRHVDIGRTQSRRDSELILSSPLVGVLASTREERTLQVQAGQVYERLSLAAAALGIQMQPMSQMVEVSELRDELTRLISPPVLFPQHPFRLGYAAAARRHTLRRPLTEVLLPS